MNIEELDKKLEYASTLDLNDFVNGFYQKYTGQGPNQEQVDYMNSILKQPEPQQEKEKTPNYFTRKDTNPIYLAGIFEEDQFCLITEEASQNVMDIHHRQPVILDNNEIDNYLDLKKDGKKYLSQIKKIPLNFYEISKEVNKPTNNYPSLISKLN